MKSIIKIKLFFFTITSIFLSNFSLAIDPVEIGKMYQKDIEVNLSIIDNLSQNFKGEKIKIEKDIRTQIKKKKNIENKEEVKIDDSIDKKLARIQEMIEEVPNEIHIFFNSETANLKEDDVKKIKSFINNQTNKNTLSFKISSYAKTNKTEDVSRRLSLDRAINIRTILLKEGVPAKNLIVKSFGDAKNKENKVIIEFEKK
jgi:outer membrane protein OmpA-like peptidoglycan-associated protein